MTTRFSTLATSTRRINYHQYIHHAHHHASFSTQRLLKIDPRLQELGTVLETEFSTLKNHYDTPRNPVILAHGLMGFDELHLMGKNLPGVQYWRGIREALSQAGVEVITATVPPSGGIEARAAKLGETIAEKAHGKSVNIIAHSMGGLDSRYMISRLKPPNVKVMSLTTIATPHRGSAFADYMFDTIGPTHLPRIYKTLEYCGLETEAFSQLTRGYMKETFNPKTPDLPGVRYYSYGASLEPVRWSVFRPSFNIIRDVEQAPNDGLVSVPSSKWGEYKGTLVGVSHLDLINWTNRLKWLFWRLTGTTHNFNAVAFYLNIADMLAKEAITVRGVLQLRSEPRASNHEDIYHSYGA